MGASEQFCAEVHHGLEDYLKKKNISLDVKDVLVHLVAAVAPLWIPLGIFVCFCDWGDK